ncbi:lmo0937 family membrane protein [Algibacter sp. 2305UL17-15]|uniref:lmo0937 family membrane protein n=1 Tax=Algibacter sp. 2305UL17-15 TaxID=3231268 RepID=UPI003459B2CB
MLRIEHIIILICLITWATGFFIYGLGLIIHLLLVLAVIVAIAEVLSIKNDLN